MHGILFAGLTPPECGYLAGNYRGANFKCLEFRPAFISIYQGAAPALVATRMSEFHVEAIATLNSLANAKSASLWTEAEYLNLISKALAMLMVMFLEIHPYANGNGHMSRFFVWFSLIKLGRPPKRWQLHTRPPYDAEIRLYREGFPEKLEEFLLKAIRK